MSPNDVAEQPEKTTGIAAQKKTRKNGRGKADFPKATRRILEERVNGHCSRCRVSTRGPQKHGNKSINIGEAAHICAAAPAGPRYDPEQTDTERRHYNNGIWLCSACAKIVDSDQFSVHEMLQWKRQAEDRAAAELNQRPYTEEDVSRRAQEAVELVLGAGGSQFRPNALSNAINGTVRAMQKADPRFRIDVSYINGQERYELSRISPDPIELTLQLPKSQGEEFDTKLKAMLAHGDRLEIESDGLKITGSPIFDALDVGRESKLVFIPSQQLPAVARIRTKSRRGSPRETLAEFQGRVVHGQESATFKGEAFRGLSNMVFRWPLKDEHPEMKVNFSFTLEPWRGQRLILLSYFEDFFKFYSAVAQRRDVEIELLIEGNRVLSMGGPLQRREQEDKFTSILHFLHLIRRLEKIRPSGICLSWDWQYTQLDIQHLELVVRALENGGSFVEPTNGGETIKASVEIDIGEAKQLVERGSGRVVAQESDHYELKLGQHTLQLPRVRQEFDNVSLELVETAPGQPQNVASFVGHINRGNRTVSLIDRR